MSFLKSIAKFFEGGSGDFLDASDSDNGKAFTGSGDWGDYSNGPESGETDTDFGAFNGSAMNAIIARENRRTFFGGDFHEENETLKKERDEYNLQQENEAALIAAQEEDEYWEQKEEIQDNYYRQQEEERYSSNSDD